MATVVNGRRRKRKRDLDDECAVYLPRLGCHRSLPPDSIACKEHLKLRLSGKCSYDQGPEISD